MTEAKRFRFPQGMCLSPNEDLLAVASDEHCVHFIQLDPSSQLLPSTASSAIAQPPIQQQCSASMWSIGVYGVAAGQLKNPHDVSFTPDGAHIMVADTLNHRVQVLDCLTGTVLCCFGKFGHGNGQFFFPKSSAC